ncbi:dTDP-4-dehydrorhamnose reductase [Gluconacetobacter diazotrophicus PA1 5]|uniref:dTDP-4-dehydrorhamnose reductase n=2 Tax=Gluconacetobacter diazotrophicus TaxID=33996 RepID=A9H3H6_GLUDA|nr:dTDP-4-dehydrorhamnose reductase [Gluconacetobacter diazotrophicus]ACI52725.1 dTDP-4-dehydrorhamnose reductase [Gluconacetobacter diazotrophicus PA1 5]MBB2157872.1 dTDP-4-dehydrorhamnose reductase [Gluconacetobacter diazotrophicus]TWB06151.1 dTDP-4-dehydrorhamnose reductase [Gluconacetobacter diazotrophicus]CAP57318.1 dTDP-4-dehydrorhamnose reductase [Gluconacetobacter diazotrophicus PA1 5]
MVGCPILVIGRSGQLATALGRSNSPGLHCLGRPDLDFDRPETVDTAIAEAAPGLVVNAAAWTAVDAAEDDVAGAERANRDGPAHLARLCAARGIPLIHVSTDYVFDGTKGAPYVETDPTSPRTVYGRSKAEGEQAILAVHDRAIILRTAWVYSPYGRNFVRTMLNAGAKNPVLRVVGDQRGNPTSADDLAGAILSIADTIARDGWRDAFAGITHAAGSGDTTWHGLAVAALQDAARLGRPMPVVEAITTADWPTPAARPQDSRLDCTRLHDVFGVRLPHWRDSVARTVTTLLANPAA